MRNSHFIILLILCYLSVGCTNATNNLNFAIGDGGLITQEPCGAPCFWGIEPGKTTQIETLQILNDKGVLTECKEIDYYQSSIARKIGGWTCQSTLDVTYRKSSGIIDYVGFKLAEPVELQKVISVYGFPDIVDILDTGTPEYPSVQVRIYFSAFRMIIPFGEHEGTGFEIRPDTPVVGVGYLDNQNFDSYLSEFKEMMTIWKGYGYYP